MYTVWRLWDFFGIRHICMLWLSLDWENLLLINTPDDIISFATLWPAEFIVITRWGSRFNTVHLLFCSMRLSTQQERATDLFRFLWRDGDTLTVGAGSKTMTFFAPCVCFANRPRTVSETQTSQTLQPRSWKLSRVTWLDRKWDDTLTEAFSSLWKSTENIECL